MNEKNKTQEFINQFIDDIEKEVFQKIAKESRRFPSNQKLLSSFMKRKDDWIHNGIKLQDEIIEKTNELLIADYLLNDHDCIKVEYEMKPEKAGQTIDFFTEYKNGSIVFLDVKTIHPGNQDDWERFISCKEYFPQNVKVHLYKDGLGGEIWHKWYNARKSMLQYTLELENKILNYSAAEGVRYCLAFCSNGTDWGVDALEDFADFYRTGVHNHDDEFSIMELHHMRVNSFKFLNNITCYFYLERPATWLKFKNIKWPVKGPWQ
jgi:hypothetical protein